MAIQIVPLLMFMIFVFMLLNLLKTLIRKSKLPKKLPPGPFKLPILGNLLQVTGALPHRSLYNLSEIHGPLMHLQLGEVSAVVISNPRVAKEVLKTHDLCFSDRPTLLLGNIILSNCRDIVLARYGDHWRQFRKICTLELLSANKVRSFRSIREEEARDLIQSIQSTSGSPVNISKKVSNLANSITCRSTIGKRCKYQHELIEATENIAYWGAGFFMADLFPSMLVFPVLSGMKPALQKVRRELDHIFDYIINEHKQKLASRKEKGTKLEAEEEDLVDILLRVNETLQLEFPVTANDIQGIVLDMFTAGTDTSSAVLEWAMSELMKKPSAMKKAQEELRTALKGKKSVTETDIQGLSYLKLVIKETLRLHPPVPLLLPRECRKECEIDGYTIPVGTKVMVNAWAIGRDPECWVDANSFIPERFEESSVNYMGANYEFIPFGAGRRMCAGISFGIASVELPLAQMLYHFDWTLPDGMKPQDLDMDETFGATTKRKNSLFLNATPYISTLED
ncbi:cytochrome P450 CYP71D312-like [Apium graveolens]|uniref:cytochrome P450 CYP71D312-like n=1 Tax=Apium graveolens TaxID=4045 RepID=UPI003D7AC7EF